MAGEIAAAGIMAAASAANTVAAGKINKKSRNFQREMFDKTNKYNTPLEQRKRLEAAGLNPNLVYGQSSGGAAGTADQPAKPDFNVPDFSGIGAAAQSGVQNYYSNRSIQSGIDVNEARAENIKSDTVNKGIDAVIKSINAASGTIDYKTKQALYDNTIATAERRLQNLGISGDYQQGKNLREERVVNATVAKLQAETQNLTYDGAVKKLDAELSKQNVRPQDPFYWSIFNRILNELDLDRTIRFKD